LQLNLQEIEKLVKEYDKDAKALKDELLKLCWFMRGGLSYTEAHLLTTEERISIAKLVEDNLETTKNTQLPFF
jgi:hypothetical protein